MDYTRKKHWNIRFFPVPDDKRSPEVIIAKIDRDDERAAIFRRLRSIEDVRFPRDWPGSKRFDHDGFAFHQVTVGRHRIYIYPDTNQGRTDAIVCHICPKKSGSAKKEDLNRVVLNIRNYLS